MSLMKIAIIAQFPVHILPEFADLGLPRGHYATWLPQLAESFGNQQEFEIHWIALSEKVQARQDVVWQNQQFHILPTATSKRAATLFRADRAEINKVLTEVKPELVHGWGNEDVCAFAASTSGYKCLVSVQGLLSEYVLRNRMPARTYLQALIEIYSVNKADAVVCESRWSADKTRIRIFKKQPDISVVDYGVNFNFFNQEWSPQKAEPCAIFTGSAEPRKGIQDAVRAFASPLLANYKLHVLGSYDTAFGRKLREQSTPNVIWHGRLPIEEAMAIVAQGWCFVLPTRADTGPMALKEARVIGLPAIASPHSGARDYIVDGRNGYLVKPGKIEKLASCLAEILGDFDQAKQMGDFEHAKAVYDYHPSRTAEGMLKIYRRLLS